MRKSHVWGQAMNTTVTGHLLQATTIRLDDLPGSSDVPVHFERDAAALGPRKTEAHSPFHSTTRRSKR